MGLTTEDAFLSDGAPFRYRWNDKEDQYRLERVSDAGGSLRVPGNQEVSLFTRDRFPRFSIVVGEEGSGLSTFREWLPAQPPDSNCETPWVSVGLHAAIETLTRDEPAGDPVRLILDRRREAVPTSGEQIAKLAGLIEHNNLSESWQVVCITGDIESIQEDLVFSSLASRGTIYRVPHFCHREYGSAADQGGIPGGEIEPWVRALVKGVNRPELSAEQCTDAAAQAKHWTGGQPSLMHIFFRRCADRLATRSDVEVSRVLDAVGDALRVNPPQLARKHWAAGLRRVLKRRPESVDLMLQYLAGQTKVFGEDDFPPVDVELFMIGWVGYNHNKQWGIRSECHRQWARTIISGGAL